MGTEENNKTPTLYFYGNEEKLDDLLGSAYHSVITDMQTQKKKNRGLGLNLSLKSGTMLAAYGLPEIDIDLTGDFGTEQIKTTISKIPFSTKVDTLLNFHRKNGPFPCYHLLDGRYHEYSNNNVVEKLEYYQERAIGYIWGVYNAQRIFPPVQSPIVLVSDLFGRTNYSGNPYKTIFSDMSENANNLWLLKTTTQCKISCEIPVLVGNIRRVTQTALMALATSSQYSIEGYGVLEWKDSKIICDPIALNLVF